MSKFLTRVKNLRSFIQLQFAIMQADERHQRDGDRYYVVPYKRGKLVIFSKKSLKEGKREKIFDPNSTVATLEKKCFYHTPYQNGSKAMDESEILLREAIFYAWKKKLREEKRHKTSK